MASTFECLVYSKDPDTESLSITAAQETNNKCVLCGVGDKEQLVFLVGGRVRGAKDLVLCPSCFQEFLEIGLRWWLKLTKGKTRCGVKAVPKTTLKDLKKGSVSNEAQEG